MQRRTTTTLMLSGTGDLTFAGFTGKVDYRISAKAAATRNVPAGAAGAVQLPPDAARDSFRAGAATLKLDDGRTCRIQMVGHSEGSGTAYFQTLG